MHCVCGSAINYEICCGQFIAGTSQAPTAEALMRSRYTAYTEHNTDYLVKTHHPKTRDEFDVENAKQWAQTAKWLGLEVLYVSGGKEKDQEGIVEFVAQFEDEEGLQSHHEVSYFRQEDGIWYYVNGKELFQPYVRGEKKLGRNDPCHCGSGKKFKKCHAANST